MQIKIRFVLSLNTAKVNEIHLEREKRRFNGSFFQEEKIKTADGNDDNFTLDDPFVM